MILKKVSDFISVFGTLEKVGIINTSSLLAVQGVPKLVPVLIIFINIIRQRSWTKISTLSTFLDAVFTVLHELLVMFLLKGIE